MSDTIREATEGDGVNHGTEPRTAYCYDYDRCLSENKAPPDQTNGSLANRLIKDCLSDCHIQNCDAQQAAHRLIHGITV